MHVEGLPLKVVKIFFFLKIEDVTWQAVLIIFCHNIMLFCNAEVLLHTMFSVPLSNNHIIQVLVEYPFIQRVV